MSAGKQRYEERRALEAERDLLERRRANNRLRQQVEAEEQFSTIVAAIHAFVTGKAAIVTGPGHDSEHRIISFEMPPSVEPPESRP